MGVLGGLDLGRGLREGFCCPLLLLASCSVLFLQARGVQGVRLALAGGR